MINLLIKGTALQTDRNTRFAVSKSSAKIGELDSRHGDLSVSFTVPLTGFNADLLGGANELLQVGKSSVYTKQLGTVEEEGSLISSGYYQVEKIEPIGKSPQIYLRFLGGNAQWFSDIKSKSILELDFSDLNHAYDLDTVTGSFGNTEGFKYFFRYDGRNQDKATNLMNISDFNLAIFEKTIVDKIFEESNVKYNGSILRTPQYYSELIPIVRDMSQFESSNITYKFNGVSQLIEANDDPVEMTFDTNVLGADPNWSGSTYTATEPVDNASFKFRAVVQAAYSNISIQATYIIDSTGGQTEYVDVWPLTLDSSDSGVLVFEEELFVSEFQNVAITVGDYIKFEILYGGGVGGPSATLLKNSGNTSSYFEYDLDGITASVSVSDLLPDISQDAFIKDLLVRNGMVTEFDPTTNTVSFIRNDEAKLNISKAIDISGFVDVSKKPEIDFNDIVSDYGKKSEFKYLVDDSDLLAESFSTIGRGRYGDGYISIDNDFIPDSSTIFESVFAPTVLSWTFNEDFFLPYIPIFQLDSDGVDYEVLEPEFRIMIDAGSIPVNQLNRGGFTDVNITDPRGNTNDFASVGYAFFAKPTVTGTDVSSSILNNLTDSLRFGESVGYFVGEGLLSIGYNNIATILNEGHLLSIYLSVSPDQIEDFKYSIPFFLSSKFISAYYQIDEISDYSGNGKSVKFKLIKI